MIVLGACLALPAGALGANAYEKVLEAFSQSSTSTIAPCEFSSATLSAALKEAPTYDYQYQADFTNAIQAALSARGDGDCTKSKTPGGAASTATLQGGAGGLPGSATSAGSGGLPLVLVVGFALAGACLLMLAGWAGLAALGLDPRFGRAARHSLREAEYRLGASWADLTDRLRRQ